MIPSFSSFVQQEKRISYVFVFVLFFSPFFQYSSKDNASVCSLLQSYSIVLLPNFPIDSVKILFILNVSSKNLIKNQESNSKLEVTESFVENCVFPV